VPGQVSHGHTCHGYGTLRFLACSPPASCWTRHLSTPPSWSPTSGLQSLNLTQTMGIPKICVGTAYSSALHGGSDDSADKWLRAPDPTSVLSLRSPLPDLKKKPTVDPRNGPASWAEWEPRNEDTQNFSGEKSQSGDGSMIAREFREWNLNTGR
jgi:hypothetical protein